MYRSFIAAAVAAFVSGTVARTADFVNMTFAPVTVGSVVHVTWSAGNGQPVTLNFANATWTSTVFENQAATPGMYDWMVTVPDSFAEGQYYLTLTQVDAATSTSQTFGVSFSTLPPMSMSSSASVMAPTLSTTMATSMVTNATVISAPTITVVCPVVWYDEECSCTKTTTTPVVMPTPTATEYVFHDTNCGCSKTAVIPEATMLPTCPDADGCNNYTAPMTTPQAPAMPPAAGTAMPPAGTAMASPAGSAPAGYMGAASSLGLSGSMIAAVVLVAGAFAL